MRGLLYDFQRHHLATRIPRSRNWRLGGWFRKDETIRRAVELGYVEIHGEGRAATAQLTEAGKREAADV